MERVFSNCFSLEKLPDISKWKTENVENMHGMFENCISLSIIPDISIWNAYKVKDINKIFYNCPSLITLPDISLWNSRNNTKIVGILDENIESKDSSNLSSYLSNTNSIVISASSNNDNKALIINDTYNIIKTNNFNEFSEDLKDDYYDNFYS